ncbi:tandem-95 repeat protein [Phenylobacterium sp.]|uniref:tandem-95 repeat protein n=1 Tax=Phenylobacterium sp. TaxID=1871053 RepID=UPI0028111C82|nr:Ig-like domain-containing protein [Phenylobacterium sp.]
MSDISLDLNGSAAGTSKTEAFAGSPVFLTRSAVITDTADAGQGNSDTANEIVSIRVALDAGSTWTASDQLLMHGMTLQSAVWAAVPGVPAIEVRSSLDAAGRPVLDFRAMGGGSAEASTASFQTALNLAKYASESGALTGSRVFVVTALDDGGGSSQSRSAIESSTVVGQTNTAPTASNDVLTTAEDSTAVLSLSDFGAYADNNTTSPAAVQITSLETAGTLEYNAAAAGQPANWTAVAQNQVIAGADIAAGKLRFAPDANAGGQPYATIGFKVSDGTLWSEQSYTLTVNVNAVNDAPTATAGSASTDEDVTVKGTVAGADVDGDALTYVLASGPANGALTLNPDGSYQYTPNANFHGVDSFSFKANDGSLESSPATVSLTVNAVNDAPTATAGSASTDEDVTVKGTVGGVDVDGDALTYVLASGPANGALTLNPDGSYQYTPNANFHGVDSFSFKAKDGSLESSPATVSLTVNAVNDAPTATAGSASTDEDVTVKGTVGGVDVDGDALTYVLASGPANGALTLNPDGSYQYTPNANFHGVDSFSFKAKDGSLESSPATVSLTVNAVNDAPVAKDGAAGGAEDTLIQGTVFGSDVENDALVFQLVDGARDAQGVAISGLTFDAATGSFTFQGPQDFNGVASFKYRAQEKNGSLQSETKTITLTVAAVNDAPVVKPAAPVTIDEDETRPLDVLALVTDVDGDAVNIVAASATYGTVTIVDVDGRKYLSYTASADSFDKLADGNFTPDLITYTVSDGAISVQGTINMSVRGVKDGVSIVGGNGGDVIQGQTDASGRQRDETIEGLNGNDTLDGRGGADRVIGGNGEDRLLGGDGWDELLGDRGNDSLDGGAGLDWLDGGLGDDLLLGGSEADTFYFGKANGRDTIGDFQLGIDLLKLEDGTTIKGRSMIDADKDGAFDDTLLQLSTGSVSVLNVGQDGWALLG